MLIMRTVSSCLVLMFSLIVPFMLSSSFEEMVEHHQRIPGIANFYCNRIDINNQISTMTQISNGPRSKRHYKIVSI